MRTETDPITLHSKSHAPNQALSYRGPGGDLTLEV
jgi:hypothetical protein